jgi:hypothetical protein
MGRWLIGFPEAHLSWAFQGFRPLQINGQSIHRLLHEIYTRSVFVLLGSGWRAADCVPSIMYSVRYADIGTANAIHN